MKEERKLQSRNPLNQQEIIMEPNSNTNESASNPRDAYDPASASDFGAWALDASAAAACAVVGTVVGALVASAIDHSAESTVGAVAVVGISSDIFGSLFSF
jgi:hypothetical protein